MGVLMRVCCLFVVVFCGLSASLSFAEAAPTRLYRWVDTPAAEIERVSTAQQRLKKAMNDPEYVLEHWVNLPTSPNASHAKVLHLRLREAILLALRYNPNIQNAELDRIVQRYQLRLAHNEFELQYALAGTAQMVNSQYSGVGQAVNHSYLATPELALKSTYGGQVSLSMDNNMTPIGGYNPLLNLTFRQPLLRGFGKSANEAGLLNAIDTDGLNRLGLQQSVMDQITQVIMSYRALILSGNNLQTQKHQLQEANQSYDINEKKIAAGQLEPTANVQQSYQIESLHLMVEQAENEFKTAAQDLLQTIGLDPDMHLAVPNDVAVDTMAIPNVAEAIAQGIEHNVQYLSLKVALRADERAYDVAKNQQLWQLDASAQVQAGTMTGVDGTATGFRNLYNGRNVTESAGVTLTIPMHDIPRRNQLITAKIRLEKDRLALIAAKRALMTLIKNTVMMIESQAKRYELAKRQVDLAEKSYALEKKKQQAGIASALDVSHTQNQLIQAQMGLISAKIAYLNHMSALQRILGTTLHHWGIQLRYGE